MNDDTQTMLAEMRAELAELQQIARDSGHASFFNARFYLARAIEAMEERMREAGEGAK